LQAEVGEIIDYPLTEPQARPEPSIYTKRKPGYLKEPHKIL
jgi:hypothetical protein